MNALNPARAELLETFALDTAMVKGVGPQVFDAAGRAYLDFLAQYGALPFGHNPPEIWAALRGAEQDQVPVMMQPLRSIVAERLAERLAQVTPGDLGIVTFTNSGAETVEAAIKLARVRTGRDVILSTWNSFHGKTLGALSATGKPMYQQDFCAPASGFDYVPFGDLAALRARLDAAAGQIAAFIVEPIQGEGGVICPPEGYLDGVIALCREFGVLSIFDEIQTGLGRTGALFACSDCAAPPDMLLLAKALGGGLLPIGACIVRPSAWDDRFGRLHSSTFANNALACTAALATLDLLLADEHALIRRIAGDGAYMRSQLDALQARYPRVIREVRGRGFMQGLAFHSFEAQARSATLAFASLNGGVTALISSYLLNVQGLLTAPLFNASHVLRLQPPLVAGRAEIDFAIAALDAVCALLAQGDTAALMRHLVAAGRSGLSAEPAAAAPDPALPSAAQVPSRRVAAAPQPGRFAFLIHYTEEEDIFRSDPSLRSLTPPELSGWQEWVKRLGPGHARRIDGVRSPHAAAEGWLMSVPMLPQDMRGKGRLAATTMIRGAVDMAVADGATRVGLGAFTSIVTRGGEMVTGRGAAITSGNTLTTVAAVQSLEAMARRVGLVLEDSHVVVIGASGAIGRLAALMLARRAGRLTLVGNAGNPYAPSLLARVADDVQASLTGTGAQLPAGAGGLRHQMQDAVRILGPHELRASPGLSGYIANAFLRRDERPPLSWTTDRAAALADADIVLVATSSETTLIDPCELRPGTLVCDVARPPNVSHADLGTSGVLVFDGGLVKPPVAIDLGPFQTLPADLCWGCLGETMLLTLARQDRDFSIGSKLPLADADLVATLADRHGFRPAPPKWYGKAIEKAQIERFAALLQTRSNATGAPVSDWSTRCAKVASVG
jgi:acetylornithine/succinyldiaminopimelate/putrescine aminotransferase/predicted amino acid dehydrogenase